MTDKWKYNTVSLRYQTYSALDDLSETLVPGLKLSKAKTIEKLIQDKNKKCSSRDTTGEHNEENQKD
tara:strand:+ start:118 stop:318 length:201 start_codon:yes stop_codon:yes gene_type:complete